MQKFRAVTDPAEQLERSEAMERMKPLEHARCFGRLERLKRFENSMSLSR